MQFVSSRPNSPILKPIATRPAGGSLDPNSANGAKASAGVPQSGVGVVSALEEKASGM